MKRILLTLIHSERKVSVQGLLPSLSVLLFFRYIAFAHKEQKRIKSSELCSSTLFASNLLTGIHISKGTITEMNTARPRSNS